MGSLHGARPGIFAIFSSQALTLVAGKCWNLMGFERQSSEMAGAGKLAVALL
jgi:hypothetical protein